MIKDCSDLLLKIALQTLEEINPYSLVLNELKKIDPSKYEKIFVLGAGKGAFKMAEAAEKNFGLKITEGFIIIPKGDPTPHLKKIKCICGSHPLPDKNGLKGAKEILKIAKKASKKDLVITLISGGGSALMPYPMEGITLEEKIKTTCLLLKCGANINEINTVRKHLSQIKGGRLMEAIYPAKCLNLVISDVLGDDLSAIASGPVSPDPTTCQQALKIFEKYKIVKETPLSVIECLKKGIETPKPGNKIFKKVTSKILANHETTAKAAEKIAKTVLGTTFSVKILDKHMAGDCNKTAHKVIKTIGNQKGLFILAGETTVKVIGHGHGGRNQQFVLACLKEFFKKQKQSPFTLLSLGTDGVDGFCPENIAGAIATQETLKKGLDIEKHLNQNDSYGFFKKTKGLIKTGPTGTNLGDLVLIFI
ncbi:MAG: DUF4147 domain-containing protein [Candidatus Gracilibacteria bacterium]